MIKPTILPARVSFPHVEISIMDSFGHLLSARAVVLQHCSSLKRSFLKSVPLLLVQSYLQSGALVRSRCLPSIHSSFMPNILESHPLAQQSLLTKPHTYPPLFLQSYPSKKCWFWICDCVLCWIANARQMIIEIKMSLFIFGIISLYKIWINNLYLWNL